MDRLPIIRLGPFLLVTVQSEIHDQLADTLQGELAETICRYSAKGVLIDISALEIVDSFIGRMLATVAQTSGVLDCQTVVVGMRPAVAITIVELGMSLTGVKTALNVDRGIELLRRLTAESTDVKVPQPAEVGDDPDPI